MPQHTEERLLHWLGQEIQVDTIDGNVVTHHVDISWNESWTGTQQIRIATFKGDRVELSTKPTPDPVSGRMSVRTITWEKISPETSL